MITTPHVDEERPLLQVPHDLQEVIDCSEGELQHDSTLLRLRQTPMPTSQLAVLCILRLLDPLVFTQIFPYVNEFMLELGVADKNVGMYSGLVESAFAVSQLFAIYPWAWLSDVVGRRPVIMAGSAGIVATTILFGLQTTVTGALVSRSLAGLFSGNVAVIPSVLCEITDSSNQAYAFPIFGLAWPFGAILGPLIGGVFSNPASQYPRLFDYAFLRTYPYFLPCAVSAVVAVFGAILGFYFLEETLLSKCQRVCATSVVANPPSYGAIKSTDKPEGGSSAPSIRSLLSVPMIRALCASGCALSFISNAFDVVFVLFCYSPLGMGGLAFSASQIGYSLATAGALAAALQLFFMPTLLRTFNHAKMYNFCMNIWPITFILLPGLNIIACYGIDETSGKLSFRASVLLWMGIALVLSMARIGYLGYSINMLLVKHGVSRSSLGSTNGLVQFFICLSRAFSPTFVSLAFTISTNRNILNGYAWVIVMVLISFVGCALSRKVVKAVETTL